MGYELIGARSAEPDTVAALLKTTARDSVHTVGITNGGRVVWLHIPEKRVEASSSSTAAKAGKRQREKPGAGWLVAAVYAPNASTFTDEERIAFWQEFFEELAKLRANPAYAAAHFLMLGDLNVHVRAWSKGNARYATKGDDAIAEMWAAHGLQCHNRKDAPTYFTGDTVLDYVWSDAPLGPAVEVGERQCGKLKSDHFQLKCTLPGEVALREARRLGSARWKSEMDWAELTQPVREALQFIAAWGTRASRNAGLRRWLGGR